MALAGAALAGDDEIVATPDEVEAPELQEERLVELRLEVPVEGLQGLVLAQAALVDASLDADLELLRGLGAENALEEREVSGSLARGPREVVVEIREGVGQPEEREVSSEPLGNVVGVWVGGVSSAFLGHVVSSVRALRAPGTRS